MDELNVTKFCDELKFNRFHWNLLVLGVLALVFDGYDSQILAYVMPNVAKEWHLTPLSAGAVVSWGLVGLMIGTAGLGMLADRIGRKIPLMLGLLMFSVFNGGLFWVHNFRIFCILRFLAGLGMGGALTLNITLASEFAPAKVRARMVATMFTGFMIGPALAGVISILFIPSYGWRIVLFFALLPLIFIPFLYFFLPESVRFLAQKGRYDKAIAVLRRMEKAARIDPQPWTESSFVLPAVERKAGVRQIFSPKLAVMTVLIWFVYFFNLLAIYGLTTWLPTLLNKSGISLVKSYGYTVIDHLGGFLGAILLGAVLDRFGRKWGLVSAYAGAAIVSWLFGRALGSPAALYALSFATGFLVIGGQSAQHAVTGEIYPTFVRSTGVGWALTMGRFGAVCGPLLGGLLQSAGFSFSQFFALLAIPPLLCAILVLFYRVNVRGETLEAVEAKLTERGA
ncbi:MAG TPA: MFS transporter [Syntrophorhabdales bacterium]|nr:MFS transporter [Syntrophorhabdales bacterium]